MSEKVIPWYLAAIGIPVMVAISGIQAALIAAKTLKNAIRGKR